MKNQPCLYLLLLLLAASCVQDVKTISSRVNYLLSRKSEVCGTRLVKFQPQRSPKIVGGTPAPYGAFPWQVEIQMFNYDKKSFEHHCGGAVIGERIVVTAAHCLQISHQKYLRVVTGDHSLLERDLHEHGFRAEKIRIHPDFRQNGPYSNDIAIIKVKSNSPAGIQFNTHVRPICLPEVGEYPSTGTWCTVSGWGVQDAGNFGSISPVLRAAAVPLLDFDTCKSTSINGGRQQEILDTMICAGYLQGGIDACGGDSGGPLACEDNDRFVLTGIVSWGDGCAKKNRPGVYTRVDAFLGWLEAMILQLESEEDELEGDSTKELL